MRALRSLLLLVLSLSALAPAARAQAVRYELDPVHTRVMFSVSHAGFSNAIGTVSGSTGELWFDPEDWSSARLRASVPIARADLGDAEWNRATLARNLLDAQAHPVATFVSTRVEPVDERHATIYGALTLHGVTREVRLDVRLNAAQRHPLPPFRRTVGFSASATISREAFGIDAWQSVIGDTVDLRIEVEAVHRRGPDATPLPPETARDAEAKTEAAPEPAVPPPAPDPASERAPEPAPEPEAEPEPGRMPADRAPMPPPQTDATP